MQIEGQKKRSGALAPRNFVRVVQHANSDFQSYMHQDAQELLSFVLNRISDSIKDLDKELEERSSPSTSRSAGGTSGAARSTPPSAHAADADAVLPRPAGNDVSRTDAQSFGMTTVVQGDDDTNGEDDAVSDSGGGSGSAGAMGAREEARDARKTLVEDLFVGETTTNTLCMMCEKVSRKKEEFMELKIEVEKPDTTLERCMHHSRWVVCEYSVACSLL